MAIDPADYLAPPRLLNRDDKLATLSIKVNEADPHLKIIDQQVCLKCTAKPCTVTCPVQNYRAEDDGRTTIYWSSAEDDGRTTIYWSNCIECGTCRVICPYQNISWKYPAGGFGVSYRYG